MYKKHYTPEKVADLLLNLINRNDLINAIDMSAGSGNLLISANKYWNLKNVAIDLQWTESDKTQIINIKNCSANEIDALEWYKTNKNQKFDLVLSNPPFDGRKKIYYKDENVKKITEKENFQIEELFTILNILVLSSKGAGVFIVPSSIINNESGKWLRSIIVRDLKITHIIELPIGVFDKISIKIYAIIFDNKSENYYCKLGSYDRKSNNIDFYNEVDQDILIDRMDIKKEAIDARKKYDQELRTYVEYCCRGYTKYKKSKYYNDKYIENCIPLIHTDNLRDGKVLLSKKQYYAKLNSELHKEQHEIKEGDILIARIGAGCIGNCSIVSKDDYGIVSDCIFIIRFKNVNDSYKIFKHLSSLEMRNYFRSVGRGTNNSVLLMENLLNAPVNF